MLALAAQWVMFSNGVFHLVTTILFREYSPGVVTGVALFVPLTAWLAHVALSSGAIGWTGVGISFVIGTTVGGLVIASLWLRMDFDWFLRRPVR